MDPLYTARLLQFAPIYNISRPYTGRQIQILFFKEFTWGQLTFPEALKLAYGPNARHAQLIVATTLLAFIPQRVFSINAIYAIYAKLCLIATTKM